MYAINHAATALIIKKERPETKMLHLLISVQFLELLWVLFSYLGIEHIRIDNGILHLDFLPYSHSVLSGLIFALLGWLTVRTATGNKKMALAIAAGIFSHVILDILFHEPDIKILPSGNSPALGLDIISYPLLDLLLETTWGIFCWWYFKGNKKLLAAIIIFNVLDLPMMMGKGDALTPFTHNRDLLPTIILGQILITWLVIYAFSRRVPIAKTIRQYAPPVGA